MKVRLLRQNRIDGKAGEIVEVSPDRAEFLFQAEAAEPVTEAREQAKAPANAETSAEKPAAKKTTKSSAKK
jgi:ribosomal protein L9